MQSFSLLHIIKECVVVYKKSGDKIKNKATWKKGKEVWRLRTAKAFIKTAIEEARRVGNEDIHKLLACMRILDEVVKNQIDIRADKEQNQRGGNSMIGRIGSADELNKEIQGSKFTAVAIPYDWTFGGQVRVDTEMPSTLIIGEEKYEVLVRVDDLKMAIISSVPRPRE